MPTLYVYNNLTNEVERYNKGWNDGMPYVEGRTMTMDEFRGSSCTNTLWTDRRALLAWNQTREAYGAPMPFMFAFKRPWEGGHSGMSQHYAGTAFDVGQTLTAAQRQRIWTAANNTGAWGYVEPLSMTPTWVHMDRRIGTPACAAGYPLLRKGAKGVYVFVLQDLLNALGFTGGGLDGVFGNGVEAAVRRFQAANGITADGVVGCSTWQRLAELGVGVGNTATVNC